MIQLTPSGMRGTLADDEVSALRAEFDRQHCVKIERLLSADTIAIIQRLIGEVPFVHRVHDRIGTEYCLVDGRAVRLLFFLVNDPALLDVIRRVTGCRRIGCFTGRVYRMVPGEGDYDTWHSDNVQERLIGMSINLGDAYAGGVFQLRERGSKRMLRELPNVVPGDAILFRIDAELEHWITPMAGTTAKTAFAGWFRASPEFLSLIERDATSPIPEPEW